MTFDWKKPPGAPPARTALKSPVNKIFTSFLVGVISVGVAWAGAGLVPVDDLTGGAGVTEQVPGTTARKRSRITTKTAAGFSAKTLADGQLLAGAAKVSLRPTPKAYQKDFPGARWEIDPKKCKTLTDEQGFQEGLQDAGDLRVRWAENTDCIYMGGYGIGPMNPIVAWDDKYGLYSRSIAMSDGSETLVLTLLDAVYWEAHYDNLCKGCGFIDLARSLSKQTGLAPESFLFASTHSHTSPDFIGGWGGVPRWYMQQTTDAMQTSVQAALASMQPAVLEMGEVIARQFNGERRDFYRSAEDDGVSWFRLVAASDQPTTETCSNPGGAAPAPAAKPICEPADPGTAIATVGAYAAHPVTVDAGAGIGDADFPGVFAKRVEESFGGLGMFVQTGLGNMSPRGGKVEMGIGLAQQIPAMGTGRVVENPNITIGRRFWDQPVTNVPLGHLGAAGVFDRTFNKTPAAISVGKSKYENKQCHSASHISVRTSVSAAKIGPLWITGGPGEVFSNLTNTIEERNTGGVTMALGLVNDGLGYIIQSFETDHLGRQGVGFVGTADVPDQSPVAPGQPLAGLSEYEDAYSIDHCFGDAVLEYTIQLLGQI